MAAAHRDPWTTLREARRTLRAAGPRTLLIKAVQELRLYRRLDLVEVPLAPRAPRAAPTATALVVRELASDDRDLATYAELRPDVATDVIRDRLRRGERCYVVEERGRILSAVWTTPGPVRLDYLQCDVQIEPPDVYGYDSFTLASRRGEDLASLRAELMKERMRAMGCRRLIATQLPENANQGRRAARLGYRPLGVIGWIGIGAWRRVFVRQDAAVGAPIGIRILSPGK